MDDPPPESGGEPAHEDGIQKRRQKASRNQSNQRRTLSKKGEQWTAHHAGSWLALLTCTGSSRVKAETFGAINLNGSMTSLISFLHALGGGGKESERAQDLLDAFFGGGRMELHGEAEEFAASLVQDRIIGSSQEAPIKDALREFSARGADRKPSSWRRKPGKGNSKPPSHPSADAGSRARWSSGSADDEDDEDEETEAAGDADAAAQRPPLRSGAVHID